MTSWVHRLPVLFRDLSHSFTSAAEKIRLWLSPPDTSRNLNEADDKREVNTCSWFFDEEHFLEWQANPGFLWVKGTGKLLNELLKFES
jgi:hypothetical protein